MRHCTICCQVLRQIGDGVAGGLDGAGGPGEAGGGGGVNPGGVVHKVGGESGIIPHVLVAEISGELVDDGRHHLHVAQLLGADIGVAFKSAYSTKALIAKTTRMPHKCFLFINVFDLALFLIHIAHDKIRPKF